jgi:hypothetical protein
MFAMFHLKLPQTLDEQILGFLGKFMKHRGVRCSRQISADCHVGG